MTDPADGERQVEEAPKDDAHHGISHSGGPQEGSSNPDEAPLERGTDPLSDDSLDGASQNKPTVQIVVFAVLALVFAYFLIGDIVHGEWGKAVLGILVVGICGFAIKREIDKNKR